MTKGAPPRTLPSWLACLSPISYFPFSYFLISYFLFIMTKGVPPPDPPIMTSLPFSYFLRRMREGVHCNEMHCIARMIIHIGMMTKQACSLVSLLFCKLVKRAPTHPLVDWLYNCTYNYTYTCLIYLSTGQSGSWLAGCSELWLFLLLFCPLILPFIVPFLPFHSLILPFHCASSFFGVGDSYCNVKVKWLRR